MLEIGWAELLVIVGVAVLVIGPRDIPKLMTALGRVVRRLQYVRFAFTQQFEDIMRAHDIDELRKYNDITSASIPDTDEAAADDVPGPGERSSS